jgi:hypothetical protein
MESAGGVSLFAQAKTNGTRSRYRRIGVSDERAEGVVAD